MTVTVKNLAVWVPVNVRMNFKNHIAQLFYFIDEGAKAPAYRTSPNKIFLY